MPTHGHGQGYTDLNFLIPELVRAHRLPQGAVLRAERRLLLRRLGRHRLPHAGSTRPSPALTLGETATGAAWVAARPRLAPGMTLLGAVELQHNDGPWTVPEDLRKTNARADAERRHAQAQGWSASLMAYDATLDLHRPDPAAADRRRHFQRPALRPLRLARPERRRHDRGAQPVGRVARDSAGRRHAVAAYAIDYELDLYSNFTYALERPSPGDQFKQHDKRAGLRRSTPATPSSTRSAGSPPRSEFGVQLRHDRIARGPVRHRGAAGHRHDARRRGARDAARRATARPRVELDALAARHRRPACRPATQQGRRLTLAANGGSASDTPVVAQAQR